MKYKWLFVVQNFEVKSYSDSAAKIEVVNPIVQSGYVSEHQVLCFDRYNQVSAAQCIDQSVQEFLSRYGQKPIVIYGAGIHSKQYFASLSQLNIVAFSDRDESLWGQALNGLPVINPAEIEKYSNIVVVSSKAFERAIFAELSDKYPQLIIETLYRNACNQDAFDEAMKVRIYQAIEAFNPDFIFYCPSHPEDCLSVDAWLEIKQQFDGPRYITLWWDFDDSDEYSSYLQFERECLQWNDLCIENSNVTRLTAMLQREWPYQQHVGSAKVVFHPTVFDEQLFYENDDQEKIYPLALFGSAAGQRGEWVRWLKAEYGDDFHHIGGVAQGEQPLSIEAYAEALRQSAICINTQTYPFREQCKGKVRETIQCGAILLEEDNKQTRNVIPSECGVIYFKTRQDLIKEIAKLNNKELVETYKKNMRELRQQKLNSHVWVSELIGYLSKENNNEI